MILYKILVVILFIFYPFGAFAENIDPDNDGSQYAWGENVGWINFEPSMGAGVTVNDISVTGYAWGENIGWINLSPSAFGGVTNDGAGNLSGYAWGENIGWISFSCNNTNSCGSVNYGVTINLNTGVFGGYAWGENIGWINFAPTFGGIKTSWRPDVDGDGFPSDVDCDDGNANIYPGATEVCNGVDDDCNGETDEGNVCDLDNDGIVNSIDGYISGGTFSDKSGIFSDNFTDEHLSGTTSGNIVNRDGLTIEVEDADPEGVRITVSDGAGTATINICGFDAYFTDGDSALITCSSLIIQVFTGETEVKVNENIYMMVPAGTTATVNDLGNGQFRIENLSVSETSITIEVNGETIELKPGNAGIFNADSDQDGVPDTEDSCLESNLEDTIAIDDCITIVVNEQVNDGCTMNDLIAQCAENAKNHGKFVSCVSHLTNDWKSQNLISEEEKDAIQSCAAQADIP